MTAGFIYSILTGLCWVCIAMLMTQVSRSRASNGVFYALSTFIGALGCLLFWLPEHQGMENIPVLAGYLGGAALFNSANQLVQIYGLKQKNCAMYFSLCQLNFLFSFIVFALFFHGNVNSCNIVGIVMISGGILASGLVNKKNSDGLMPTWRDLLLGFLGICLGGMAAVLMLRAGTVEGAPATLKIGMMMGFSAVFHVLRMWVQRETVSLSSLKTLAKYSLGWAILAAASYACIFWATSRLEPLGRTGLIYAIACSTDIIGYWLYSVLRLKTGTNMKQALIMLLLLAGIVIFRLG